MRAGSVHHVAVLATDLARAEAFYAGVLGLPVVRRWSHPDGTPRSLWVELDSASFLAIETGEPKNEGAWHCVALAIPRADRDAWRERLERAGHPIERETPYTIYARDPDGALIGLSHWPDPA